MMEEKELLPCPFCGGKAHFRHKTMLRTREDEHGNPTEAWVSDMTPWGEAEYKVTALDGRYGIQVYCGRCKTKARYAWGEWNRYTDDELDEFDAYDMRWSRQFDKLVNPELFESAAKSWNTRAAVTEQEFAYAVHDGQAWKRVDAIALTAEQVRDAVSKHDCKGWNIYGEGVDWQAVADELNQEVGA